MKKGLNVYQDISIKKNSSSTSELLNTSAKSQKNTHRMLQDGGQLKTEKTARDMSSQHDSVLKTNLLKKMQQDGITLRNLNGVNWAEPAANPAEIRKLESIKTMCKTQQAFKGNKASVKQLREKENSSSYAKALKTYQQESQKGAKDSQQQRRAS